MTPATCIIKVDAWEAFDSRGNPTVAARVEVASGASAVGISPSGASTGRFEALELRDGEHRYEGLGVLQAVANVQDRLGPSITGADALDQRLIDELLMAEDGDRRCRGLGANAVLAVSLATAQVAALATHRPLWDLVGTHTPSLPLPMVNIFSGGAHAGGAIDIQDVLAVPLGAPDVTTALRWCWEVRRGTAAVLGDRGYPTDLVADEGGLAAPLTSNQEAIEIVCQGIEAAGRLPGVDVAIAIDVAANSMQVDGGYRLLSEDRRFDVPEWIDLLKGWVDRYPLVSLEDPLGDDDVQGWRLLAEQLLPRIQLLGDDLFATDLTRLEGGIADGIANAVLVKPNQNGTVTGAAQVARRAQAARWSPVISARSGDTEQSWLTDLAVGWGAGQIKVGSLHRSERTAKWNRLLELEATTDVPFARATGLAGQSIP